jgi:quercetin dioxygenase-like cupin family protein
MGRECSRRRLRDPGYDPTGLRHWDLMEIEAPNGTRDPVVLHSDHEARAVLIRIRAGQRLGDHEVKERAWIVVLEGRVQIGAAGDLVEAGPGMLFRFDASERHSVSTVEGARILLLLAPWPGEGHYRGSLPPAA